ncbi:MAG: hypothetical protein IJW22_00785 [Clostridia bacterium]|nr:hypothetical protein [Clostridia bacterium]
MKKHTSTAILIVLVHVFCVGVGTYGFLKITDHRLYEQDGYTLNSRVYFSKLEITEKRISYHIKNETRHDLKFTSFAPNVYYCNEDGEWEEMRLSTSYEQFGNEFIGHLAAFEERHSYRAAGAQGCDAIFLPGTYCIVLHTEEFCVVDYVTLTQ